MKDLSPKQERFCREYMIDLNGTQAAIRAGYSPKTANEQAARMLAKASIKEEITSLNSKKVSRLEISAETVLKELLCLATVDLSKAYFEDGNLKPIHEIPEDVRRAMCSIDVFDEYEGVGTERSKVGETRKVKFYDKTKALELLGKHLKLYTDKVEHSARVTLESLLDESRKPKVIE